MSFRFGILSGVLCSGIAALCVRAAEDPLAAGVRTSEPLSPAEQQARFKLPPGFEIQLVAAEPDLRKPMNMAFDARGRLWVTESREYPFPAKPGEPARDSVRIFSDFDPETGRARKMEIFADGLNIPTGVLPYGDGAIVWSIPNLWYLRDTDGDGKCDQREILFGPLGWERDTHGNLSSYRRGWDGWIYGTHGFNNDSHFKAKDGSELKINSGNTWRIRPDGSRVEPHTWGQVNPFGLAWDDAGNLYSSDCHSAPIYQLLHGGVYPSFGKPHDGLGYAPTLMEHAHGSTAIDGALYYADDLWPREFHGNFFVGNVMTSRLNRDQFEFTGSTPRAVEKPDFLTCDDTWFRPVDNQLGPDGAVYIADFYNRIIGHYEVPLLHPGRDRERGRLWRVIYRGPDGKARLRPVAIAAGVPGLISELASPNLTRRMLAMNTLSDHAVSNPSTLEEVRRQSETPGTESRARILADWILHRHGRLAPDRWKSAASHADPVVRVHALRMAMDAALSQVALHSSVDRLGMELPERKNRPVQPDLSVMRDVAVNLLRDPNPLVVRCAAEVAGLLPGVDLQRLTDALESADTNDTHLVYVLRKSVRDQLARDVSGLETGLSPTSRRTLPKGAEPIAAAVKTPAAAEYVVLRMAGADSLSRPGAAEMVRLAVRHGRESTLAELQTKLGEWALRSSTEAVPVLRAALDGYRQRGLAAPSEMKRIVAGVATELLSPTRTQSLWTSSSKDDGEATAIAWTYQDRPGPGGRPVRVLSSFPSGESRTGTLRSPDFRVPAEISFLLSGHDGPPGHPPHKQNRVRLVDAVSGVVLRESDPPRQDPAVLVNWKTADLEARLARLEIVDGDAGSAYAWLALGELKAGDLTLPSVAPGTTSENIRLGAQLAGELEHSELAPRLLDLALDRRHGVAGRVDAALAMIRIAGKSDASPSAALGRISALLDVSEPGLLRESVGQGLAELSRTEGHAPVVAAMKTVPARVQQRWAVALAASGKAGAEALLTGIESGVASPRILQGTTINNRLRAARAEDWESRVARLTSNFPPESESINQLIQARHTRFKAAKADPAAGRAVFEKHCRACHQFQGVGGLVGPQLTGIGKRGVERLCEDILDPNRNVDHAFQTRVIQLKDGESVSGLFRREEGEVQVLANAAGQEFSVRKSEIQKTTESPLSLMPENFGESIPAEEFDQLLTYLLSE